jgi:hypothetical protein
MRPEERAEESDSMAQQVEVSVTGGGGVNGLAMQLENGEIKGRLGSGLYLPCQPALTEKIC